MDNKKKKLTYENFVCMICFGENISYKELSMIASVENKIILKILHTKRKFICNNNIIFLIKIIYY